MDRERAFAASRVLVDLGFDVNLAGRASNAHDPMAVVHGAQEERWTLSFECRLRPVPWKVLDQVADTLMDTMELEVLVTSHAPGFWVQEKVR